MKNHKNVVQARKVIRETVLYYVCGNCDKITKTCPGSDEHLCRYCKTINNIAVTFNTRDK